MKIHQGAIAATGTSMPGSRPSPLRALQGWICHGRSRMSERARISLISFAWAACTRSCLLVSTRYRGREGEILILQVYNAVY